MSVALYCSQPGQTDKMHLCFSVWKRLLLLVQRKCWPATCDSNAITFFSIEQRLQLQIRSKRSPHNIYVFPDGHYARLGDLTCCDLNQVMCQTTLKPNQDQLPVVHTLHGVQRPGKDVRGQQTWQQETS